jgi:hypothetical protein
MLFYSKIIMAEIFSFIHSFIHPGSLIQAHLTLEIFTERFELILEELEACV